MAMSNSFGLRPMLTNGKIYGLAVPFEQSPGFALPVVQHARNSNARYIQRTDIYGKIVSYETFDDGCEILEIEEEIETRLGADEIFGVVDPYGVALAGTKSELAPNIAGWVNDIPSPILRFSFANFIQDESTCVLAATEAIEIKTKEFGSASRAAKWFIESALIADIMRSLLQSYEAQLSIFDIDIDQIPPIRITMHQRGNIEIEVPADVFPTNYDKKRRQSNLDRIFRIISQCSGFELVSLVGTEAISLHEDVKATNITKEMRWVQRTKDRISRIKRQEVRLASVMEALIQRPDQADSLLRSYSDKGAFCQQMIRLLQYQIDSRMDQSLVERRIAEIIPVAISSAHPMQKGQAILGLARVLGGNSRLNSVIRHEALRRQARDVVQVRDEILRELEFR